MLSDEELVELHHKATDDAMHAANMRDGYGSNMSRESIVAGLRAVEAAVRADEREERLNGTVWRDTIDEQRAYIASLTEQLAAVRADMQREVQTVEWAFADLEFFVRSESAEGTIGAFQTADMAKVFADRLNSIIINDTFYVTPSTPNQQGAEQK